MPDIGTGISAGLSLFSASEGKKASDRSGDLAADQLRLEAERDAFNREQVEQTNEWAREDRGDFLSRRERERGLLDPIQEGLIERAAEGPDYAGATRRSDADVAQAYGLMRDQLQRDRSRYGINPASGRASYESRRIGNEEALAKVSGRAKARLVEDDRDWARKIAAFGTGNLRDASPNTNLAQLGVSGASGVLGNMASNEGANAAGAFQLAGSLFADTMDNYNESQKFSPSPGATIDYDAYSGADFEQEYGISR